MDQQTSSQMNASRFINAVRGFRCQAKDVARAATFHTQRLGFALNQQLPAFANVSLGDVDILLSGPGASGSQPDAEWRTSGARWMEPCGAAGGRPPRAHRRTQER
jgi:hypothetical protein